MSGISLLVGIRGDILIDKGNGRAVPCSLIWSKKSPCISRGLLFSIRQMNQAALAVATVLRRKP